MASSPSAAGSGPRSSSDSTPDSISSRFELPYRRPILPSASANPSSSPSSSRSSRPTKASASIAEWRRSARQRAAPSSTASWPCSPPTHSSMQSSTSSPHSSSERALEVHELTGPKGSPLIFDIEMFVARGETLLVLGPIQSGKSMLMRHLVGLECAAEGSIAVDGHGFDPTKPDDKALRSLRARVGVLFEGSALLRRISVVENVELPLLEHHHS